MKFFRDIRVLPVVLLAILGLAVLKISGLALDGRFIFAERRFADASTTQTANAVPPKGKPSWAEEMFNFPSGRAPGGDAADVTGSAAPSKPKDVDAPDSKPVELKHIEGEVVLPDGKKQISDTERAVLERLQDRRKELETRAREIEIRENLLKSNEKKVQERSQEIKAIEAKSEEGGKKKGEAEAERYKGLVTMYENMKPKDAAKIFDRLDMKVLYDVVSKINPRKMSDILAQMSPEAAEKLTVEIASRAGAVEVADKDSALPKIEGKPVLETKPKTIQR